MRILHVGRYFPPHIGGIETLVYNLVIGMRDRGISCDVLCSNKRFVYQIDRHEGFTIHRTRSLGQLFSVSLSPQLIQKLRNLGDQYDIVHLHHPDPLATLALFFARPSAKVIVHWHSDIVRQRLLLVFFKPLQDWMLRRADRIIVTSRNYADGSQHLAAYRNKIEVIPIGIPNHSHQLNGSPVDLDFVRNKFVIFSLGRLVYYKGFEFLIDAAKLLDGECVVVIGGGGPLKRMLQKRIDAAGLGNKVLLLGEVSNERLASWYKRADVFSLPSIIKTEAFGIVLLEAMSYGKPLVTTNLPDSGIAWINRNNVTGLTVPVGNAVELASAIRALYRDTQLRESLGRGAKARYEEKFTAEKMVQSTLDLYRKVAS